MEKRVLIAALLSGVVVVLWFAVMGPKPPVSAPGRAGISSGPAPQAAESPAASETVPPTEAERDIRPAARGTEAEVVTLQGPGVLVSVDSRGGVLRSVVLPDYRSDAKGTLDLVATAARAPLSLAAAGPWNDEVYQVERIPGGVMLSWSDGAGNWIEKRIVTNGKRFGLDVGIRGSGSGFRSGIVVASGIGVAAGGVGRGQFAGEDAVFRAGGKLKRVKAEKIEGSREVEGGLGFIGIEDQYFILALLPGDDGCRGLLRSRGEGKLVVPEVIAVPRGESVNGTLYAGAKEHGTLAAAGRGLDETVSFGIFGVVSVAFLAALRWIYSWAGNWGLAIVVLTAGIRLLLFPLNHKSTTSMRKMQAVQPKMKAIQDRYKDRAKKDPQVRNRMNQEVMQLYKQEGVNPMGGCLPMLVQMPILFALYTLFAYAIELRQAPFMLWITDLSLKDPYYITPILMTATMVLQQKITPQVGDPAQRKMFMFMPFIFGFMFLQFPAGLVLYWLVNNILTIGQQWATDRFTGAAAAKTA